MAYEDWTVDGQNLSNLVRDIESFDGLDDMPDLEGDDISLEQMHGVLWNEKFYGEGFKSVSMIVSAGDPITGIIPASLETQRNNIDTNYDSLIRILYRPRRLLDVRRVHNGVTKQAFCAVEAGLKPERVGLGSSRVGFIFKIPGAFWQDVNNINSALYNPASNFSLAEFVASTAPMDDLKMVVTGPAVNPRVTDVESGSYWQYTGTVAAGQTLTVDSATMGISGTGFAPLLSAMSHDGSAKWIEVNSSIAGCLLTFTASSTTIATKLQVIGKRKWLR